MSGTSSDRIIRQLSDLSVAAYRNPYQVPIWPKAADVCPEAEWFFSEPLLPLYGTPEYAGLSEAERHRLSFYEQINFFSLNIHGERELMRSLTSRLYRRDWQGPLSTYLHHFLGEENNHSLWFGTFCLQYAGKIYPNRSLPTQAADDVTIDDFLVLLRAFVFEAFVDYFNQVQARDTTLNETVRCINQLHHEDESRHLAFGKVMLKELFHRHKQTWGAKQVDQLQTYAGAYLTSLIGLYFNPSVYRDAGLSNALLLRQQAMQSDHACRVREAASKRLLGFLHTEDMIRDDYVLGDV